jgi:hypothetical protein
MIENPSGGTLTSLSPTSALYTAGTTDTVVDIIEAWDGENRFGRGYINVISSADVAKAGKAIVIAGRKSADDPLWPTTDYLADVGYNTLLYRGFSKAYVRYLSPVPGQDVDGNGVQDDIAGPSTLANAALAFTNWAVPSARLFVYLVDHGGDSSGYGYFRLNPTQTLTAVQLDGWLDAMQDRYTNDVVVVIDFCNSGSFVDELAYTGAAKRIVIASCASTQSTYFVSGGLVSFSDAFFNGIMAGQNLGDAFLAAKSAMASYQSSQLDANGDGQYTGADDEGAATNSLGASFVAGKDIPQIGLVCGNQLLTGDTVATLWADNIYHVYDLTRVWCLIVPPSHTPDPNNPVSDLPQLDLARNPMTGRYEANYSGFSEEGTYKVAYYAKDEWGSVSLPRQSYVLQSGFKEKVILVNGCPQTDPRWGSVNAMSRSTYHVLRKRLFKPEMIQYLSAGTDDIDGDGTNDVDALPTLANLANAFTNFAAGADKLTVCLIGAETNSLFRLDGADTLSAAALDAYLDTYQQSNGMATVVLDFDKAGGWLSILRASADQKRVCIAAARGDQLASILNGGLVSFSQSFFGDVFSGYNVWDAFERTRKLIRNASCYRSLPQIDDDGDGLNTKIDGTLARKWHIGSAFITGADTPTIATVMPDGAVSPTGTVLWVSDVTDMDGISNVWCVITPPDYTGVGDLLETNLAWNAAQNRYEALYTNLQVKGVYAVTFYARDITGEVCSPRQALLSTFGDAYEPDDTPAKASFFVVGDTNGQRHTFHLEGDEDWVRFYATTGTVFNITATQLGENSDVGLEVWYLQANGVLTNVIGKQPGGLSPGDMYPSGLGEVEELTLNLVADPSLREGFYFVRVTTTDFWGNDSDYELRIDIPVGGGGVYIVVSDSMHPGQVPSGTVVVIDHSQTQMLSTTSIRVELDAGEHSVTVPVMPGYWPDEDRQVAGQVTNPASFWYGNPKAVTVAGETPQFAIFMFTPVMKVEGRVRDALTGAWVPGAEPAFVARNGTVSGEVYTARNGAGYEPKWVTGADGRFPAEAWLPAVDWTLTVAGAGYATGTWAGVVSCATPGQTTDVGVIQLAPLDVNGNGIADAWEAAHFVGGVANPTDDDDDDGANNRAEYLCGTDPTNAQSVLKFGQGVVGTNGFTMSWPVVEGRTYSILAADGLQSNVWPAVGGPWTAGVGQTNMEWADTNAPLRALHFYRVGLETP